MYHFWNVYGIAAPRQCELDEALNNGIPLEQIVAEIEALVARKEVEDVEA
jgi:hypothetical protein